MMALTKDFKDTIQARARRDSVFRKALLQEGVECLLAGGVDTGKAVLRDYINATIGFEELSRVFDKSWFYNSRTSHSNLGLKTPNHYRFLLLKELEPPLRDCHPSGPARCHGHSSEGG
jgi:hypothetical protein